MAGPAFQLGRYEAAMEHFERAAALTEEGYGSLSYLAQIYRILGRDDEARDAARRALERIEKEIALHPDNALALSFGIGVLVQLGDRERAKEWISRTLIVEPDDAVTHYNLACSLAQMGETDRALDLLEPSANKLSAQPLSTGSRTTATWRPYGAIRASKPSLRVRKQGPRQLRASNRTARNDDSRAVSPLATQLMFTP